MLLTIISATNPKYTNADGTGIDLMVQFQEFSEVLAFHAIPTDCEAHGVELYNNAVNGLYGLVAPYIAPTINAE